MDNGFLIVIALFFAHELDAILQKEWRFFGALLRLDDAPMYKLFIALHVPLLVFLVVNSDQMWLHVGLDIFAMIHVALHWFLRKHPLVGFNNWFSWLWIVGTSIAGGVHLWVSHLL